MHPIHIFCLLNYLTNSPSSAINCSIADDGGVELDYGSDDKDEGQTLNFSEIFDENLSSNEESNIVFASENFHSTHHRFRVRNYIHFSTDYKLSTLPTNTKKKLKKQLIQYLFGYWYLLIKSLPRNKTFYLNKLVLIRDQLKFWRRWAFWYWNHLREVNSLANSYFSVTYIVYSSLIFFGLTLNLPAMFHLYGLFV